MIWLKRNLISWKQAIPSFPTAFAKAFPVARNFTKSWLVWKPVLDNYSIEISFKKYVIYAFRKKGWYIFGFYFIVRQLLNFYLSVSHDTHVWLNNNYCNDKTITMLRMLRFPTGLNVYVGTWKTLLPEIQRNKAINQRNESCFANKSFSAIDFFHKYFNNFYF